MAGNVIGLDGRPVSSGQPGGPVQVQERVDIENSQPITCDVCGGEVFDTTHVILREVKMASAIGHTVVVPIPILWCVPCNRQVSGSLFGKYVPLMNQ